eukprot:COSAG01_NODE_4365_length_5094_cov_1.949750_4_plen_207_part_00
MRWSGFKVSSDAVRASALPSTPSLSPIQTKRTPPPTTPIANAVASAGCRRYHAAQPPDRYTPLALLALELLRSGCESVGDEDGAGGGGGGGGVGGEAEDGGDRGDGQGEQLPEGLVVGAAGFINWLCLKPPRGSRAAHALWEAGFLGVLQTTMRRYSPMQRISRRIQLPGAVQGACKDIVEGAHEVGGAEVVEPLLAAGAVDLAIS